MSVAGIFSPTPGRGNERAPVVNSGQGGNLFVAVFLFVILIVLSRGAHAAGAFDGIWNYSSSGTPPSSFTYYAYWLNGCAEGSCSTPYGPFTTLAACTAEAGYFQQQGFHSLTCSTTPPAPAKPLAPVTLESGTCSFPASSTVLAGCPNWAFAFKSTTGNCVYINATGTTIFYTPSSGQACVTPTLGGGTTKGGGTFYYANWTCGSSSQCASIMGAASGSAGPLCSSSSCTAWGKAYIPSGYTCSTTASNAAKPGGSTCSTCTLTGAAGSGSLSCK